MNKVFRKCNDCHHVGEQDEFSYLGACVFCCPICLSKYTEIVSIDETNTESTSGS